MSAAQPILAQAVMLPRLARMAYEETLSPIKCQISHDVPRRLCVDLRLPHAQMVTLELLSLQGERLLQGQAELPAGPGRLEQPTGKLPPGLYLLRLHFGQNTRTEKIFLP